MKKTHEEFINEVKNLVGNDYTVLSNYTKNNEKIKFQHNKCGNIFEMKPTNFLSNGQRCPKCNSNFNKVNIDIVRDIFLSKNLTLLSDVYTNSKEKLKYRCNKCGDIHSISYTEIKTKDNGCAKCAGNKKLNFSDIKLTIESVEGYTLLSPIEDFKNVHSSLKLKHSCGMIYRNSYNNFRNGQRCPLCAKKSAFGGLSKDVIFIIQFLIENNIEFEREKKYNDLIIDKRKGRYDFYFPTMNLLLEYHGIQHSQKKGSTGIFNDDKIQKIKTSDKIKKEYALKNNINIEYIYHNDDTLLKLEEIITKYNKI